MKGTQKLIITIASSLALMTTAAVAEQEWQGGMMGYMGGPGMMSGGYGGCMMGTGPNSRHHGMMHGQGAGAGIMGGGMMQNQLVALEKELNLTGEQQAKWRAFEKTVEQQANSMLEHHQQMLEYFKDNQSLTLPKRLERHTQLMGERYASMTAYSSALTELYQSLNSQQQKVLDQNMFMGCF